MKPTSPVLRDLPDALTTERLQLRCPRPGDGVVVHDAVVETLPDLRAWGASLPWAMAEPSVEASETFCREMQADWLLRRSFALLMFRRSDGHFVGTVGLHHVDWSVPKCESGYWCRSSLQGQGLMTEALRALADWALDDLGMQRIDVWTDAANSASRALCERAGFELEGVLRQERVDPDGMLRDTCVYALLG